MNTNFSIKINGLDDLIADANKLGGEMPGLMLKAMVNATTMVQEEAKRIGVNSFKNRTGNLRRSIFRRVESAARGVIGVGEPYGIYVEQGTRPHTIYPRNGKFLAFKNTTGDMVFARKINHPGSRPYPFMEPAFDSSQPKVVQEYNKLADYMTKKLAGK